MLASSVDSLRLLIEGHRHGLTAGDMGFGRANFWLETASALAQGPSTVRIQPEGSNRTANFPAIWGIPA